MARATCGFPLRCFEGWWHWYGYGDSPSGLISFDTPSRQVELPAQPLALGLIINTALYSVLWYLLLLSLVQARRLFRRRRGRCPRCAYDLRHDLAAGCPECGWNRA